GGRASGKATCRRSAPRSRGQDRACRGAGRARACRRPDPCNREAAQDQAVRARGSGLGARVGKSLDFLERISFLGEAAGKAAGEGSARSGVATFLSTTVYRSHL